MLNSFLALIAAFCPQTALAQERPAAFVDAASVVPGLIVEMRYAGAHNFVGRPIDGYEAPRCLLTKPAANALAGVAQDVAPHGLVIKVFDCYRPTRAVANFVRWARDLGTPRARRNFIPMSTSARCFATAISPRSPAIRAARPST